VFSKKGPRPPAALPVFAILGEHGFYSRLVEIIEDAKAIELITEAAATGKSAIQALREYRGISQEDFASLTGVALTRIRGEEVGRFSLTQDELDAIAAILGVPVELLATEVA